jgi:hypothetical protein
MAWLQAVWARGARYGAAPRRRRPHWTGRRKTDSRRGEALVDSSRGRHSASRANRRMQGPARAYADQASHLCTAPIGAQAIRPASAALSTRLRSRAGLALPVEGMRPHRSLAKHETGHPVPTASVASCPVISLVRSQPPPISTESESSRASSASASAHTEELHRLRSVGEQRSKHVCGYPRISVMTGDIA